MLRKYQAEYDQYVSTLSKKDVPTPYKLFAHRLSQKASYKSIREDKKIIKFLTLQDIFEAKEDIIQDKNNYIESLELIIKGHEDLNRELINKNNDCARGHGIGGFLIGLLIGAVLIYYF